MIRRWRRRARSLEVPCTVEIEQSRDHLHAHVALEGVEIGPGDAVLVHGAPSDAGGRERLVCERRATIVQAGRIEQIWTRLRGLFEIGELFEVGFSSRRRP